MPTDDNKINSSTYYIGQSLAFIQHDVFISVTGLLMALLDKRLLNWSVTFHSLLSP